MEKIILVKPNLKFKNEILDYKKEFLDENTLIHGSSNLTNTKNIETWLADLEKKSNKSTLPKDLVISSTFLALRENDNYIVGMIDIRHYLNNYLLNYGGHIGYSVRKSERNKGYAKQMLNLALDFCKDLKLQKVLITCDEDNIASEKVILAFGGVLEDIRESDNEKIKRFWINLL